eukprot:TRINITY_DN2890_c0_g1_i5.p1 TRINITY_DN2890_c0_g1~~TRINITY_DN2890_c0_g1_i5.p1  ORF type:complete len:351 (-),score=134.69 TRINITY_DN2890_c0_g1_i5:283-1335(-)
MLEEEFGSDTDDDDYVPEGENNLPSEEEGSGDDEKDPNAAQKSSQNSSKKKQKRKKKEENIFSRNPTSEVADDWNKFQTEVEKEKNEKNEQERIDSLWSAFKSDVDSKPSSKSKQSSETTSKVQPKTSTAQSPKSEDSSTKKPSSSASRFSSLFDPTPSKTENKEDPTKADSSTTSKPKSRFGSLFDDDSEDKKASAASTNEQKDSESPEEGGKGDKVAITKVYDFAGEMVKVTKEVDADSKEAKKFQKEVESGTTEEPSSESATKRKAGGGLASVVGNIGKKAKMGCLDKSKLDWNQFVQEEGIKEDLASFNRGKDGFVERQMFLERADHRQFEIEKSIREKNRKSFMK